MITIATVDTTRRSKGDGGVRQRSDGAWEATVDLGRSPDGKRQVRSFRGRTKQAALARRREALGKIARGEKLASSRMTVGAWIDHWLETTVASLVLHEQLKRSTAYSYRTLADEYVKPCVGSIPLDKFATEDVDAMTGRLRKAGYKPNTIRLARSLLRTALNAALRAGHIARNPVTNSVAPNVKSGKRATLDLDQVQALMSSLGDKTYGPLIEVALWTGMRKGELLALRWPEVDFEHGVAMVDATLGRITGEGLLRSLPKTDAARDTVPLVGSAIAAVRRQRSFQEAEQIRLGSRWRGGDYVFHGPIGGPLDPSKASKEWNVIRDRLGLPKITFHDLRHTTATLLRDAGVPLEVISRVLRHSSITVTADVYTKVGQRLAATALEGFEAAMKGAAAQT